jgi:RecB family endonuclease NucS
VNGSRSPKGEAEPGCPKRILRSAAMRLLVARCEVLYTGRLTARLPEAVRLLIFKADGSFLVHDDAGGFRPLNWIRTDFPPDAA